MSRRLALCALASLWWGCTTSIPAPRYPFASGQAVLEAHQRARAGVTSLQAEARVDQRGRDGRIKGTVLMLVEQPSKVRLDVMTQFGPIAIFTSDGADFAYSDLREKRYLTGPTCPRNIARLMGVPLTAEQTTTLLLGGSPLIAAESRSVVWQEQGFYRVELRSADGARQELDLAPFAEDRTRPAAEQRLRLLRSELYEADGRSRVRITYEDHEPVGDPARGLEMAYRVRVEQPREGTDTVIRFKELNLDRTIPEGAFRQQPRGGMRVEEAPCDEAAAGAQVPAGVDGDDG